MSQAAFLAKKQKYTVSNTEKNSKCYRPVNKNQLLDRLLDAGYVIDERKIINASLFVYSSKQIKSDVV